MPLGVAYGHMYSSTGGGAREDDAMEKDTSAAVERGMSVLATPASLPLHSSAAELLRGALLEVSSDAEYLGVVLNV